MFAIFFHESMNPFHQTVMSFPTVIFTVLLIICLLYWVVAVLGMVDLDLLDMDLDGDIDSADSIQAQNGIAGLLLKFGLGGVPLTITITFIALFGWLLSYYASYFIKPLVPTSLLKVVASIGILVTVTYIAIMLTSQVIKPIRSIFAKLNIDETKHILGQVVTVRSGVVTKDRGEAIMNDGGADLLLNIRASGSSEHRKGDEVVVIEQINKNNLYRVISKSEFDGK